MSPWYHPKCSRRRVFAQCRRHRLITLLCLKRQTTARMVQGATRRLIGLRISRSCILEYRVMSIERTLESRSLCELGQRCDWSKRCSRGFVYLVRVVFTWIWSIWCLLSEHTRPSYLWEVTKLCSSKYSFIHRWIGPQGKVINLNRWFATLHPLFRGLVCLRSLA